MSLNSFHPAVAQWFASRFAAPTEVQQRAWPAIRARRHVLLAAPTGSGKTLAAFLAAIDELVTEAEQGARPAEVRVLYVSPLKALSNDIQKNLQDPLAGIQADIVQDLGIRTAVRTGDTPASERARMRREPPHILVTTPESLYILLTSESGRAMLGAVRTVIVDELHAVADSKRGAHLMLSLERLGALCARPPVRIGISATQKPITRMAEFLLGAEAGDCEIVDTGHVRERDLALELPPSGMQPIMAAEVWTEIYDRLAALVLEHRSTLIFVNTRRLAERVARHLAERMDPQVVTAHHGSLAKEHRLDAERRLKAGQLRALVATASLELGIDIGEVDLCCQLGSPHAIATFLQRVGRSGHGVNTVPKGRLFPLSRDDLVECAALLDSVRRRELDEIHCQGASLDVLSQQIVAEVAAREWSVDELYALVTRAAPYRALSREKFDSIITMLADGFSTRRGRRSLHLHYDAVNGKLRGRAGARLTAVTNGGAIPDQFDYDVVLMPQELPIGTLNEDFAFESMPGDIFQLGNTSYRILKVETGTVRVADAQGAPPTIPFWFGEAPGRSDELSLAVSRLRETISEELDTGAEAARRWLDEELRLPSDAAEQIVEYLGTAKKALGVLPTRECIVLERFFDEVGDSHLVIHSPYGSRINRAWGLALRKRFCRKFNYELQAAALEDSIVISLGPVHSFPLEEVMGYLKPATVREVLTQALLAAPMFPTRWRWAATTALSLRRFRNGKKVPPQFQRSDAEDLLALVFPEQIACAENITGDRQIPDHPLVEQVIDDCLHDIMDIEGLEALLTRIAAGEIRVEARDVTTPSPLAQEIISAKPYAFLDDAPAEERRTQAIRTRHLLDPADAANLAQLDPEAIARVCAEAWPEPRSADELHDALVLSGFITAEEAQRAGGWEPLLQSLIAERRATVAGVPGAGDIWVAAERLAQLQITVPVINIQHSIEAVRAGARGAADSPDVALRELLRGRLEALGPVTVAELAAPLALPVADVEIALAALEGEGAIMRGQYRTPARGVEEWCERRLLARIHRYTIGRLREQIQPVSPAVFMQFLCTWHGLGEERSEGPEAVRRALSRLQGFPIPAAAWEREVLTARIERYTAADLDAVMGAGHFVWLRAAPDKQSSGRKSGPISNTPILILERSAAADWLPLIAPERGFKPALSSGAERVHTALSGNGAMFFVDLVRSTGLLRTQVEQALGELVAWGLVTSDTFAGLRALITPASRRPSFSRPLRAGQLSVDTAGRWSCVAHNVAPALEPMAALAEAGVERAARALLERYGVVFRAVLRREGAFMPPWRELARLFRRMEARGELRGGRFVSGFSGEQFALPEAVDTLRSVRRHADRYEHISVAAADPLNLDGAGDQNTTFEPATVVGRLKC
jgi:ATP-dependent Lhr-like helicase